MPIERLHHVAYRCLDAKQTVEFYEGYLDLQFDSAIAENIVPSTGERYPHIHIFMRMPDGSSVAFFELPESPAAIVDPNTPFWVQHLALKVDSRSSLISYKTRLEEGGIEVVGPINHTFCESLYFKDPNGHRLELTSDIASEELLQKMETEARPLLEIWDVTREAPEVNALHASARP